MIGIRHGQGVRVDRAERRPEIVRMLAEGTDDEVRGVLARMLAAADFSQDRAARILRTSPRTYRRDLRMPSPIRPEAAE